MAGLKRAFKVKLAASSILEVVISMVMIVLVLGLGLMIYSNVMRQSLSARQLKARLLLDQVLLNPLNSTIDQSINVADGWQIEQKIINYEEGSNLYTLHLTAFDPEHNRITESEKVIIIRKHD